MKPASIALILALASAPVLAGKPSSAPSDPKVAYSISTGSGVELRVTNQDGTGSATIYKSPTSIRFDLGPRSSRSIAMVEGGKTLKLLTYDIGGAGNFTNIQVQTLYTSAKYLNGPDFSPNGTRIVFGAEDELKVHDLIDGTTQTWTRSSYIWDAAWYKDGNAIAFIEPPSGGTTATLFEISAPGGAQTPLVTLRDIDQVDRYRTSPDALVLSYRDTAGNALIGKWEGGTLSPTNLANRSFAFNGTLNCDDSKLVYGSPDKSGQTVWYIRDLNMNSDSLYTKAARVKWTQMWPTC